MNALGATYLDSAIQRLLTYKILGDSTFAQLEEQDFHYTPNDESNSISVIIRHLHGNMISRWTNFLTEDGEKPDRNRDSEFTPPPLGKEALIARWEEGWNCLLSAPCAKKTCSRPSPSVTNPSSSSMPSTGSWPTTPTTSARSSISAR